MSVQHIIQKRETATYADIFAEWLYPNYEFAAEWTTLLS